MKFCGKCGAQAAEGAGFCTVCGAHADAAGNRHGPPPKQKRPWKYALAAIAGAAAMLAVGLHVALPGGLGGLLNGGGDGEPRAFAANSPQTTPMPAPTPTPTLAPMPTPAPTSEPPIACYNVIGSPFWTLQGRFPLDMMGTEGARPVEGGHIRVAAVSDAPFAGLFSPVFSTMALDREIGAWFGNADSVFSATPLRTFGQDGIATFTHDIEEMSVTITQVEDVYWHDGHPLTLGDLAFAIETILHPDYVAAGGIRQTIAVTRIRGSAAFTAGTADHVSGLALSNNDRTLKIYFDSFPPSLLYFGFWSTPKPRHIFQNVPVLDIPTHYNVRTAPMGWGPFFVQNMMPGEAIHMVANESFWMGRPYLDTVTVQLVQPDMVPLMMLSGEFDIALWDIERFPDFPNPTNWTYVANPSATFSAFSFNLGYFVPAAQHPGGRDTVVGFDESYLDRGLDIRLDIILDPRFRQAMNLAIDVQRVSDSVFMGLRFPAASPIPPSHAPFISPRLPGMPFDPERANDILDEIGLYWPPGEPFRLDRDGNPFHIRAVMAMHPTNELMAMSYAQDWRDVGIDVRFDFRDHQSDIVPFINNAAGIREGFEMAAGFWTPGLDPNPDGLWGHGRGNIPRFMNERWSAHLEAFNSERAWRDQDWLLEQYFIFQDMWFEYWPSVLLDWRISMVAFNNRITNATWFTIWEDGIRTRGGLHRIQVTSHSRFAG